MVTPNGKATVRLSATEARRRCLALRLVLTDCDGVLTDGSVYVSSGGEELKRFSLRDGMGFERLRAGGIEVAIVTRERSDIVARRAEKLGVRLFQGVQDKAGALPVILAECRADRASTGYIGDDVNDEGVMAALAEQSLVAAPADADASVIDKVHYVCARPGGAGAFRELADWILSQRAN